MSFDEQPLQVEVGEDVKAEAPVVPKRVDPQVVEGLRVLKAARDLISKPENWCQEIAAADANGEACDFPKAVQFCALGSIYKVCPEKFRRLSRYLDSLVPSDNIAGYNDTHTHAEVLAVFDKAIANLEAQI